MDFTYSPDEQALRAEIIEFAQRELRDDLPARDRAQQFSRDFWQKCGRLRLQGLPVDETYGGRGVSPLSTALALEALGYGCPDGGLVFALSAHLLACVVPVWKHGSEGLKQRYLPRLCDGSLIAANGMTEPASGSDAFAMSMRAVQDGAGFRLNGTKTLISNAPIADVAVVYAVTDEAKGFHGGVSAFLVEMSTPGVSCPAQIEKMSLRTTAMGSLVFENAFVPAESVIGAVGSGAVLFSESMEWERICLVAGHIGKMEWLLEQAVRRARTRTSFGQKIGKYQAVSHRIADMKIRLEATRWLVYRSASRLGKARDIAMDASITKVFASESFVSTSLDAVRTFGGYGVLTEYEVERTLRDSVAGLLYSGTNDMQRDIIARWMGL